MVFTAHTASVPLTQRMRPRHGQVRSAASQGNLTPGWADHLPLLNFLYHVVLLRGAQAGDRTAECTPSTLRQLASGIPSGTYSPVFRRPFGGWSSPEGGRHPTRRLVHEDRRIDEGRPGQGAAPRSGGRATPRRKIRSAGTGRRQARRRDLRAEPRRRCPPAPRRSALPRRPPFRARPRTRRSGPVPRPRAPDSRPPR